MTIRNVKAITKKEIKGYFDGPTAYIVMVVFLILWEYLFFRSAFLVGEASLRFLFDILPWLFILLIPAITMGSISQERGEGTLEFLLTHPLRDSELITGKFVASVIFAFIVLLFIFPIAISFSFFGKIDWGIVLGQYLAGIFLASVFIALGIFISSLFESQIVALLTTAASAFLLVIAGLELVTASLPPTIASLFEGLSVLSHFDSTSRGVIDLRDLWYYLSMIIVFLSLTYLQLLKRRFGNRRSLYRSYRIGVFLLIGIAILTNIVGSRIPGRIDLTQNRIYSLSEVTRKTLKNLNDVVNITLFASNRLPAQFKPILRDVKDMLRDYKMLGNGNVLVKIKDPNNSVEIANEAKALGVQEVQFNVLGQGEFQLKTGYLGLVVSYTDKNEVIPFVRETGNLEYQLTSFIKQLTTKMKKKVFFLTGHGEKSIYRDYRAFVQELKKQFDVDDITLDSKKTGIPEDTTILVIAGPKQKIDDKTRLAIKNFLLKGRSVLFLVDTVTVNPQLLIAIPNEENLADFLNEYGVTVEKDIVYDLRSNETVTFGGGPISYLLPYPFWARVFAVKDSDLPVLTKIESLVLPWASSITLDNKKLEEKGLDAFPLLTTTPFAGHEDKDFPLSPGQKLSEKGLKKHIMAISLSRRKNSSKKNKGRIVVVGDSDFLSDQFLRNSPENIVFGIDVLSWLGQEESIAGLRVKQRMRHKLLFENETQVALIRYGNMLFAAIIPSGVGLLHILKRRSLRRYSYSTRL